MNTHNDVTLATIEGFVARIDDTYDNDDSVANSLTRYIDSSNVAPRCCLALSLLSLTPLSRSITKHQPLAVCRENW